MGHHNTRVGTIRYMAPEVLSKAINGQDLEALTKADMYSFALVLWELCSRTNVQHFIHKKPLSSPEKKLITYLEEMPYNLPYSEYVDADPTVEDMNSVVNIKKIRPCMLAGWQSSKYVSEVSTLMKESWQHIPSARPPMLRAKKTLNTLKDTLEKEKTNTRQLNNQNLQQKEIYSYDKKESLSADSDNYSQNSSLTNSIPSTENGVRFS